MLEAFTSFFPWNVGLEEQIDPFVRGIVDDYSYVRHPPGHRLIEST
jgi:hypothetical protein